MLQNVAKQHGSCPYIDIKFGGIQSPVQEFPVATGILETVEPCLGRHHSRRMELNGLVCLPTVPCCQSLLDH